MFQANIALVTAADLNISGREYFSSVPDGPFNAISACMDLVDYEQLHIAIHKNKQCEAHWENDLRKYAHRSKPLFDVFTSVMSLRFVLERKIDVPRDWELHLEGPMDDDGKLTSLTHVASFFKVCAYGDAGLRIVRAMVERTQVDLEARDDDNDTSLLRAARYGHLRMLKYLCEQGGDKEARYDDGMTPLQLAAYQGRLRVVKYMCEQGGDKEARDGNGFTPLHIAACNGHLPVVQYLCEQGADKEARDDVGWTPLLLAAGKGHLPVVQYLCEQGADKEARDNLNRTPLHIAATNGHLPVVQYLKSKRTPRG